MSKPNTNETTTDASVIEKPIINAHTHIFNADDVPQWIAKKFVPLLFLPFVNLRVWIGLYTFWEENIKDYVYKIRDFRKSFLGHANLAFWTMSLYWVGISFLFINVIFGLLDVFDYQYDHESRWDHIVIWIKDHLYLIGKYLSFLLPLFILVTAFFSKLAGKIIWKLSTSLLGVSQLIPDNQTIAFAKRYIHIVKYARYKTQDRIYHRLYKMYPGGSKFVVLPMDMEHMGAGKTKRSYLEQLHALKRYKEKGQKNHEVMLPFIFADPRRFDHVAQSRISGHAKFTYDKVPIDIDKPYFDWKWNPDSKKVELKDSWMKDYLEVQENRFSGIKIYPALGYYNYDLQINFTHPLNYLILLEPSLLREHLHRNVKANLDKEKCIHTIFGYDKNKQQLDRDLRDLKINIAHYGGSEEWLRYWELDRVEQSQEIEEEPTTGFVFLKKKNDEGYAEEIDWGSLANLWNFHVDWYTIISSMMLQYKNVYADISYTLHHPETMPLLNRTMQNPGLARKVLFGTDFYVVRNHKSEKQLFAELSDAMSKEHLDQITRENTFTYLETRKEEEARLKEEEEQKKAEEGKE